MVMIEQDNRIVPLKTIDFKGDKGMIFKTCSENKT